MVMVNAGLDWAHYFAARILLDVIMKLIGVYYAGFADRYTESAYCSANGKQPKKAVYIITPRLTANQQ